MIDRRPHDPLAPLSHSGYTPALLMAPDPWLREESTVAREGHAPEHHDDLDQDDLGGDELDEHGLDEDELDEDGPGLLDPNDPDDVRLLRETLATRGTGKPSQGLGHMLALFLVSVFLFWVLESVNTDRTGTWIAALVLVLAVHETGHFIAMRTFGFTDLKVFFVPFFGAAASGRKIDATPTQHALVSLMGPLPGLVLAFVASLSAPFDSRFVADVVVLALAINAFNLLPVLPLDGGHFLHWTLFARWPSVRRFMRLINALALVGVAWFVHAWILVGLGMLQLHGALTLLLDDTTAELRGHLEDGEDLSLTVPDRVLPIAMDLANRRRFARATRPVEPGDYARAILPMWAQIYRSAPIPMRRTVGLLIAYVGTGTLIPAALLRLLP